MERIGQRELYARGGITKWYWDCRDRAVLRHTLDAKSILDIGCGEGITLGKITMQNSGRLVMGIDPEPGNIKMCGTLTARVGSVYHIPNVQWDCCLLLDVLEHVADPITAIRNIHAAMKHNGKFLLMFPNDNLFFWARILFMKIKEAFADYGHLWNFDPDQITDMLQEYGFSVDSVVAIPSVFLPLHYLVIARKV